MSRCGGPASATTAGALAVPIVGEWGRHTRNFRAHDTKSATSALAAARCGPAHAPIRDMESSSLSANACGPLKGGDRIQNAYSLSAFQSTLCFLQN